MPSATLTFASTTMMPIAIAGSTSTGAEILTAINAHVTASAVWWTVSDFNATNGTLELKRKTGPGSVAPSGEQSTVRVLFFGGVVSAPNAAAVAGISATASSIYVGLSVDANTTGPAASFTTGAPYTTKYTKAVLLCANGAVTAASSPRVYLIESEDSITVSCCDTGVAATAICGRLAEVDPVAGTNYWAILASSGAQAGVTSPSALSLTNPNPICPLNPASLATRGVYWNNTTATARSVGRCTSGIDTTAVASGGQSLGQSGQQLWLMDVGLMESTQAAGTATTFLGKLRQHRLGPAARPLDTITYSSVVQAIHFGQPNSFVGYGGWADNTP